MNIRESLTAQEINEGWYSIEELCIDLLESQGLSIGYSTDFSDLPLDIQIIHYHQFDSRRYSLVVRVVYKGQACAVVSKGGREGRDLLDIYYIGNPELVKQMIADLILKASAIDLEISSLSEKIRIYGE